MQVFRKTGSVHHNKGARRSTLCTNEVIEDVEERMKNIPSTLLKHMLQEVGIFVGTCNKIVKKLHLFPYKLHADHELLLADFSRRIADGFLYISMITCWI